MKLLNTQVRGTAEGISIPVIALLLALIPFALFVTLAGAHPGNVLYLMYFGAFGKWFSWQNTLERAMPIMLAALCTALPARLGMVIIGGEGAVVLGGLTAAAVAHYMGSAGPGMVMAGMVVSSVLVGALWIGLSGALRIYRGVNETISSLLLTYIAIALFRQLVEGALHDPASLNKPSTWPIGDQNMLGTMFGSDIHWGLAWAVGACLVCWILMNHTTFGFAARMIGGNVRAAKIAGLAVGRISLITCCLGGGAAGLAGMMVVATSSGSANDTALIAGYGYTGILVAFMARQNPLGVIPIAILLGGIGASNGLLQRRENLPDATVLVLQGILFVTILASESFYGRFKMFQPRADDPPPPLPPVALHNIGAAVNSDEAVKAEEVASA